ncbi:MULTISPECIES: MFS transporter [unclassified Bradyrhizobium]|uniref:MFS transporter n=1 Tax=unclassified Bradyrhizobium TaxID=2631580 RepID=UPI0033911A64
MGGKVTSRDDASVQAPVVQQRRHHSTIALSTFSTHLACELLTDLGILIQGVGAAWAMTQLASSADQLALVQTALLPPIMLIAIPAGTVADMHDSRIVGRVAHSIELCGATALAVLEWPGLTTPDSCSDVLLYRRQRHELMGPAW